MSAKTKKRIAAALCLCLGLAAGLWQCAGPAAAPPAGTDGPAASAEAARSAIPSAETAQSAASSAHVGAGTKAAQSATLTASSEAGAKTVQSAASSATTVPPAISAKGAVLIDAESGQALYEKNADGRLYPASTTKIMTALIVYDVMEETETTPDSRVVIPAEAAGVEGSSIYLKAGENVSLRELLYGMMLQSGNDAACALAICCGGNMEEFISLMNDKAAELGCGGTHFTNPSGLFDEEHYTTARDLARIAAEAMKNEDFRKTVGAKSWESPDSGRRFANKNKTISQYAGATGVKIGYTKLSGRTLAASAERNGRELIAVVLDDPNWFADAYALLDYGFALP